MYLYATVTETFYLIFAFGVHRVFLIQTLGYIGSFHTLHIPMWRDRKEVSLNFSSDLINKVDFPWFIRNDSNTCQNNCEHLTSNNCDKLFFDKVTLVIDEIDN